MDEREALGIEALHVTDGIGDRLKRVRKECGYTQKSMAEAIGAALSGYQQYESGRSVPGGAVVAGLVQLGINANWLLTGNGPMLIKDIAKTSISPAPVGALDVELLGTVLEAVEEGLAQTRRKMAPDARARLVLAIYELYAGAAEPLNKGVVLTLVKSAR